MTWVYIPSQPFEADNEKPTELNLFSGGGGSSLASQHLLDFRTVCYVEWAHFQKKVLQARQREGYLQDAPIWDDVRTFDAAPWCGLVDIVTAGFPCQGYSDAGPRLGSESPHNQWPATIRIIRAAKPRAVLLENVAAIYEFAYLGRILADLAESGYVYRWADVPAFAVGAPHLRERFWLVAHAAGERRVFTDYVRETKGKWAREHTHGNLWWKTEPEIRRVDDGLARGMGRALHALGDGWVPAVAARVWKEMMEDNYE